MSVTRRATTREPASSLVRLRYGDLPEEDAEERTEEPSKGPA